jgi:hypothetical protein
MTNDTGKVSEWESGASSNPRRKLGKREGEEEEEGGGGD